MYKCKLKTMPYAQCEVLIEPHEIGIIVTLRSYNTDVVSLSFVNGDLNSVWFGCVNYSPTTARHVNRFTTEWLGWNAYHYAKENKGLNWLDDMSGDGSEEVKRIAGRVLSEYLKGVV